MPLVFEEPSRRSVSRRIAVALAELRAHPGRWARIAERSSSNSAYTTAAAIRGGKAYGAKPGEFEAAGRCADGVYAVYARYIGTLDSKS